MHIILLLWVIPHLRMRCWVVDLENEKSNNSVSPFQMIGFVYEILIDLIWVIIRLLSEMFPNAYGLKNNH